MTVTATANKYRYQGNGVTDTFAFPARVYSVDDLVIEIITRSTDALEETLVLTTDYTVTIASNGTASVQVTNGAKIPDNTQDILIYRELENEQTLSLPTGTVFPAKSVETQLDRAVSQIQDLKEIVDRSIKIPVQSSLLSLEIESLPEAGKSLKWNATEDGLINSDFDPDEQAATATAQAVIATTQAGIATTAANNAAADAIATAADRVQTGLDAAAAAQSALAAQVAKMEWQGAWSAGTYQINDVVEHNGSSWIATAVTTEEPSISATDWDLVALKGVDGVGLTDGDKGDITVSSSGSAWALNDTPTARSNLGLGALAEGDDASDVPYDNATSGLTASDVQAAIDEIAAVSAPTVDPTTILPWGDHFETAFAAVTASGLAGNSYVSISGAGATAVKDASALSNARGVISLQTGTTSSGAAVAVAGANAVSPSTGFSHDVVGAYKFKAKAYPTTLSVSAQRFWAAVGVSNVPLSALPDSTGASRAWHCFRYKDDVNSGNWVAQSSWNGASETTNTSVAAINTDFQEFEIRVNAANNSVTFYINGALVATHTTNLVPTATIVLPFVGIQKTVGGTSRTLLSDYIYAAEG
jgi:hypothetical protein